MPGRGGACRGASGTEQPPPVVLSWPLYRYLMRISASRESRLGNLALRAKDLDDLVLNFLFICFSSPQRHSTRAQQQGQKHQ